MIPPTSRLTAEREQRKALVLELHGRGLEPVQIAVRVGLMEVTVPKHLMAAKLLEPGKPGRSKQGGAAKGKK